MALILDDRAVRITFTDLGDRVYSTLLCASAASRTVRSPACGTESKTNVSLVREQQIGSISRIYRVFQYSTTIMRSTEETSGSRSPIIIPESHDNPGRNSQKTRERSKNRKPDRERANTVTAPYSIRTPSGREDARNLSFVAIHRFRFQFQSHSGDISRLEVYDDHARTRRDRHGDSATAQ